MLALCCTLGVVVIAADAFAQRRGRGERGAAQDRGRGRDRPARPRGDPEPRPKDPYACTANNHREAMSACAHLNKDRCSGVHYCDRKAGRCKLNHASRVKCYPGGNTACMTNRCDPKDGECKPHYHSGKSCSDQDKCTVGDRCNARGQCIGHWSVELGDSGESPCQCKKTADCAGREDGNLCNGTLYCDKKNGKCKLNPATKVTCPSASDVACRRNGCDPKTGKCRFKNASKGKHCDDGNNCTSGDRCNAKGVCLGEWNARQCECSTNAHCKKHSKNKCEGSWYCDKASHECKLNKADAPTCKYWQTCNKKTGKCVNVSKP